MLKKLTLSLIASVLFIQQSLAGIGSSTPLNQEQERQRPPVRRAAPPQRSDDSDDNSAILAGFAGLAIGSAIGYSLYKASQELEPSPKPAPQNFQDVALRPTKRAASNLNSRRVAVSNYQDTFSYANETFSEEAWRKANGLPNRFSTPNPQSSYARPIDLESNTISESEDSSNSGSSYSQTEDSSESSESSGTILQGYKGCPIIDLSDYETRIPEGAIKVDLHPVYNGNFQKHLRNEIFNRQRAYHRSETTEKKLYIITGTGRQRPGPNFTLQNAVKALLTEDYFHRRIAYFRLEKEGFFAIFLRKNIRPMANKER